MSDPQSKDWRNLEAGRDLDAIVAQFMGWKIDYPTDKPYARVVYPGGGSYPLPPIETWTYLKATEMLPHYSTNLNAAFMLFSTELGLEWNLFSDFNGITCELGHWNNEPGHADQVESWNDKTAALAICKAWLKWQERTDHAAPEFPKGTEADVKRL